MAILNEELDSVLLARDNIKTAIINKGQTVGNDLRTYAEAVSKIQTGVDTDDADAIANDILNPKTAYVKGQKITGNILPSYDYADIVPEDLDELDFGSSPMEIDRENGYALYIASDTITIKKINNDNSLTTIITITPADLSTTTTNKIYNASFTIVDGLIRIVTNGYNDKLIYLLEYNLTTFERVTKTTIAHNNYSSWGANNVVYKFSPINPNEFIAFATSNSYASVYYYTINSAKLMTLASTTGAGNYGISSGKLRAYFSNNGKYLYCFASYVYTGNRYAPQYYNYIFSVAPGGVLTSIISGSAEISYGSYNGGAYYMLDNGLVYEAWAVTPTVYKISGTSLTKLYIIDIRISEHGSTSSTMFNTSSNFLCALGDYLIFRYTDNIKIYKVTEQSLILYKTISAGQLLTNHGKSISFGTSPSFGGLILNSENARLVGLTRNGFSYIDTSNATAIANNILEDKTAYVNGIKLTGTMPNNGALSITPSTTAQTIPSGYTSGGTVAAVDNTIDENITQANIRVGVTILGIEGNLEPDKPDQIKTVTPSTSQQVIEPDVGYELSSVTVNPVTASIDSNILPENIKKDVTILGVTGTHEGGGSVNYNIYIQQTEPEDKQGIWINAPTQSYTIQEINSFNTDYNYGANKLLIVRGTDISTQIIDGITYYFYSCVLTDSEGNNKLEYHKYRGTGNSWVEIEDDFAVLTPEEAVESNSILDSILGQSDQGDTDNLTPEEDIIANQIADDILGNN